MPVQRLSSRGVVSGLFKLEVTFQLLRKDLPIIYSGSSKCSEKTISIRPDTNGFFKTRSRKAGVVKESFTKKTGLQVGRGPSKQKGSDVSTGSEAGVAMPVCRMVGKVPC